VNVIAHLPPLAVRLLSREFTRLTDRISF
jgi:hypothetical protein